MSNNNLRFCIVILAAGTSSRYLAAGGLRPKLDEDLGSKPVLQRVVEMFTKFEPPQGVVSSIVVAGPHDADEFAAFKERHQDRLGLLGARVCRGGATHRWESVKAALALVPDDCTHVAVHDAARACTPLAVLERVFDAAARHPAVIPVIEVSDTLKRVETTDEVEGGEEDDAARILGLGDGPKARVRVVSSTIDRTGLFLVQTPQVFEAGLLRRAYAQADLTSTDDAGLVERLGERIVVVEGDSRNLKITRPVDLELARAVMGLKPPEGRPMNKKF